MSIRRTLVFALALALTSTSISPALLSAAQENGVLSGKATDKAKAPYDKYSVRLRNTNSPSIIKTIPLDAQGTFSFDGLALAQSYLVELFDAKSNHVVCTEGPFALSNAIMTKTDVNIDCGKNPTAWILAAGAGAAIIAAATASNSNGQ
jgi:hypothetical protein